MVEDQGEVGGDTTFGGDVRLDKGAKERRRRGLCGGRFRRDPGGDGRRGTSPTFSGSVWLVLIFGLPFVVLGAFIALIVWLIRRLTASRDACDGVSAYATNAACQTSYALPPSYSVPRARCCRDRQAPGICRAQPSRSNRKCWVTRNSNPLLR